MWCMIWFTAASSCRIVVTTDIKPIWLSASDGTSRPQIPISTRKSLGKGCFCFSSFRRSLLINPVLHNSGRYSSSTLTFCTSQHSNRSQRVGCIGQWMFWPKIYYSPSNMSVVNPRGSRILQPAGGWSNTKPRVLLKRLKYVMQRIHYCGRGC